MQNGSEYDDCNWEDVCKAYRKLNRESQMKVLDMLEKEYGWDIH